MNENFYDKNGKFFMVYCPKCRLENHAMCVSSGICAWCGFVVPRKETKKKEEK